VKPECPYCGRAAHLVSGDVVYPHRSDLAHLKFWRCAPCKAYVGCHRRGVWVHDALGDTVVSDGTLPLGSLANGPLRQLRTQAHAAFDGIWKSGSLGRDVAYAQLAAYMDIPTVQCHIAMFDEEQCRDVIKAAEEFWKELRRA